MAESDSEAAESQANLARGGLPLEAQKRLAEESGARPLFTSDLSVDEFLLARSEGYEAVGQVMGSSVYHVGWQFTSMMSGELTAITHAHMHARALAMGRMQQEATALKAHGVIGVRLTAREYEWGPGLLEFTAMGTAVRLRNAPAPASPFLSDLSGEDFWTLVQAGYLPKGLAMGFCSYFVYSAVSAFNVSSFSNTEMSLFAQESLRAVSGFNVSSFYNQELTSFSEGLYHARQLAMKRLKEELVQLEADGVVGVKVETNRRLIEGGENQPTHLQIDFFAVGTAIAGSPSASPPTVSRPVLNMTGLQPIRNRLEGAELQQ